MAMAQYDITVQYTGVNQVFQFNFFDSTYKPIKLTDTIEMKITEKNNVINFVTVRGTINDNLLTIALPNADIKYLVDNVTEQKHKDSFYKLDTFSPQYVYCVYKKDTDVYLYGELQIVRLGV